MFSVMNKGICLRPSCTAMFSPTISGTMVDARDHVRITAREFVCCAMDTLRKSLGSMYGPFLTDRDIFLQRSLFSSVLVQISSGASLGVRRADGR